LQTAEHCVRHVAAQAVSGRDEQTAELSYVDDFPPHGRTVEHANIRLRHREARSFFLGRAE
jgi:hypothetical protein